MWVPWRLKSQKISIFPGTLIRLLQSDNLEHKEHEGSLMIGVWVVPETPFRLRLMAYRHHHRVNVTKRVDQSHLVIDWSFQIVAICC